MRLLIFALLSLPAIARAQNTVKCEGQSYAEIAERSLGDARLGQVVAVFNGKRNEERCVEGRFVRLPLLIRHELALGQTVQAVAERFTRGSGGEASIRERNGLAPGVDPPPGTILEVPSELELQVGTRPEAELSEIPGLPDLAVIKRYNGVAIDQPLPGGGTIYVPVFLTKKAVPPPPPPEIGEAEPPRAPQQIAVSAEATREGFRHREHREAMGSGYECSRCHAEDASAPHTYHAVPNEVCARCHATVAETAGVRAHQLGLSFSHDLHLDPERKVKKDGYQLDCAACHAALGEGAVRERPAHPACIKCHNPSEVKPVVAADCTGCHAEDESLDRLRLAIALLDEHFKGSIRGTDVEFSHSDHQDAPCERCHSGAAAADTLDEIEPQRMADCLACHRGLSKEMAGASISLDRCRTCHLSTNITAPAFGSVVEKPISHTRAFRIRHRREAERDRGTCAACHFELAGGDGARCDRCHSRTRPEDHTVRWREEPHGRAAARNADRCAACHQRDRCASCHAVAPRDHSPRGTFIQRHSLSARTSTRRCLTCHLPETDCARCHDLIGF
jgi:hypothetical protein